MTSDELEAGAVQDVEGLAAEADGRLGEVLRPRAPGDAARPGHEPAADVAEAAGEVLAAGREDDDDEADDRDDEPDQRARITTPRSRLPCVAYAASATAGMTRMTPLLISDVSSQPRAKSALVRPHVR